MQLFLAALGASQRAKVTRSDEELGPAATALDLGLGFRGLGFWGLGFYIGVLWGKGYRG